MQRMALILAIWIAGLTSALAQNVTVIGPITPGNVPQFSSPTIIKDSGVPGGTGAFANPTGAIGLTAVNGSALTAMRSDAAPPLSASVQSALTGTNNGVALGTGAFGFNTAPLGTNNQAFMGNTGGAPGFRSLVGADIPTLQNLLGTLPVGSGGTGVTALATAAQYIAGTVTNPIPPSVIYTSETTTTFGATTTFDFSTFINTAVTLTGNITTMSVANVTAGKAGTITFVQDATGSRTTVFNTVFKFPGGNVPALSTAANAVDVLSYSCRSAAFCVASLLKGVQ
jgi:hypothetical protein